MRFLIVNSQVSEFKFPDKSTGELIPMKGYLVDGYLFDGSRVSPTQIFVSSSKEAYSMLRPFNVFAENKLWLENVDVDLWATSRSENHSVKYQFVRR